jgi:hypothetical protein
MDFDHIRGRAVLFGGYDGNNLSDTWEWDGANWTQVASSGPAPRSDHAMAWDAARGRMVLFSGWLVGADTWEWDGTVWTQVVTSGPSQRFAHAMTYDAACGRILVFGGWSVAPRGDTWEYRFRPDINDDGIVDAKDRDLFVQVLLGLDTVPEHVLRSDVNGDGAANGLDVHAFVAAMGCP